jgi:hypothetical protein
LGFIFWEKTVLPEPEPEPEPDPEAVLAPEAAVEVGTKPVLVHPQQLDPVQILAMSLKIF